VDSGYYAACSGLRARIKNLDLVAHNLANVNTTGYRAQQPTFESILAAADSANLTDLNRAINNFGVLGASRTDLAAGSMERTGNALDVAIEGKAFFAVQTARGVLYTRNGNFQISTAGQLVTKEGDPVLGEQGPLLIPAGEVSISADGTLSVAGAVAGKIRLTEFGPGAHLVASGDSCYLLQEGVPRGATGSYIRQGMLEASNVNPVSATVSLIEIQRNAEMLQRALSAFHSDLNRIAANDLPRL